VLSNRHRSPGTLGCCAFKTSPAADKIPLFMPLHFF
jgi:hypothetical protein